MYSDFDVLVGTSSYATLAWALEPMSDAAPSYAQSLASADAFATSIALEPFPGGGYFPGLDPLEAEGGDDEEGETVTVTGKRLKLPDVGGGSGGDGPGPSSGAGGEGGGGGGVGTPNPVATHTQDCSTSNGAAVQVAEKVKGTGPSDSSRASNGADWTSVEFGAVIVRNSDGTFGALNDSIYSDGQPGRVTLPGDRSAVYVGEFHNHPRRSDDPALLNVEKYPSGNDWAGLADAAKSFAAGSSSDPSIWIMGPDGVTREFKLSERNAIEAMSRDKLERGEGLNGRERTTSCG